MKRIILLLLILIPLASNATILNMIALEEAPKLKKKQILEQLYNDWQIKLADDDVEFSDNAIVFEWNGEMFGIMLLDVALPWDALKYACEYSPTWENASEEMKNNKAHMIISIVSKNSDYLSRQVMLSKVIYSFLSVTKSIGVLDGESQLVRSKEEYMAEALLLKENELPIANWVFLGIAATENGTSAFTVGLKRFGYRELEILRSQESKLAVYELFYNTCNYVIGNEVVFKNKETIGYTQDQKLPVKITKSSITDDKKVVLIDF